mmetsp:Transcript_16299/g.29809  ORF Transcript_16299/g.29809 Transcript_16299/m.29809 type:complete len:168 (-) Transcript_16299:103-606(-)
MSVFELSAIKLWISSATILPFAFLVENGGAQMLGFTGLNETAETAYHVAVHSRPALGFATLGGGIFVLAFQVNVTLLSKMSTAVTVGVVGGLKILPQWLTAAAFNRGVDLSPSNVVGVFILLVSSIQWAYLRYEPSITTTTPSYACKPYIRKTSRHLSESSSNYGTI